MISMEMVCNRLTEFFAKQLQVWRQALHTCQVPLFGGNPPYFYSPFALTSYLAIFSLF